MIFPLRIHSEIWRPNSEIWPDFAKSEILPKSGIWLFPFCFKGLEGPFQISEGYFRNLLRNLDLPNNISDLRQISDFRKVPPKGVGVLPATGGESHHLPLGNFSGRSLTRSTPRADNHKRRKPMADQTMTNPNQEAIQKVPPAFTGQRTLLALDLGKIDIAVRLEVLRVPQRLQEAAVVQDPLQQPPGAPSGQTPARLWRIPGGSWTSPWSP